MLSSAQVQRVWEGMLAAEMRALYFGDLAACYGERHRYATWAALVASSGAVAALLADLPNGYEWIRPGLAVATAVLTGYSLAMQIQKRAVDASDLAQRWMRIKQDYEAIWENVAAGDAPARLREADAAALEASKPSMQLPHEPDRVRTWQDHVEDKWEARRAAVGAA